MVHRVADLENELGINNLAQFTPSCAALLGNLQIVIAGDPPTLAQRATAGLESAEARRAKAEAKQPRNRSPGSTSRFSFADRLFKLQP